MSSVDEKNPNNLSVCGRVIRISSEPKTAAKGGYLFRGLELAGEQDIGRIFIIFPHFAGDQLYEFPLLCWTGAEITGFNLEVNNRLEDGTIIYAVTPESDLVLEPRRTVSVTEAVEAAACIRSADVRFRVGPEEPFWMAKGKLIHSLFEHILCRGSGSSRKTFQDAYRKALPALVSVLPGSNINIHPKTLEGEAQTHFSNVKSWLKRNGDMFECAEVETDRMSSRWGLKGRADALFRSKDRRTIILELKSGKVPVEDHLLQLFAYSLIFSDDASGVTPDGYILYSATGKAEKLTASGESKKRIILDGRNKVISLKHSFTQGGRADEYLVCGRNGKCFSRPHCTRLFNDRASGGGAFPEKIQREYYDRWFRLLSIDAWAQEGEFARILDPNTLDDRISEGVTFKIAELKDIEKADPTGSGEIQTAAAEDALQCEEVLENSSRTGILTKELVLSDHVADVAQGEEVILHRGDPCGKDAFRVRVAETNNERILVKLKVPFACFRTFNVGDSERFSLSDASGWYLDRIPFSRGREIARYALFNFFQKADPSVIKSVVRGQSSESSDPGIQESLAPASDINKPADHSEGTEPCYREKWLSDLNEHQEAAIRQSLDSDTFHLIHGPPGTGKTRVLARLIGTCLDRGERILVACPTNVALDRLLLALMNLGVRDFLRIGGRSNVSREFLTALEKADNPAVLFQDLTASGIDFREFKKRVTETKLIGATAYQCAAHPVFLTQKFDRVIIDEAGQLDEPSTLGPLSMARRFVLGGDHFQLPPVVKSKLHREESDSDSLERSLFERLFDSAPDSRISRLKVQYRMNREIQEIPSRLFYGGALQPSPEAASRRLSIGNGTSHDSSLNRIMDPELPVVFVDVEGSDSGKACPQEAEIACRITEALVARGVAPHEIGIITPYRAQQSLIRRRLFSGLKLGRQLSVDTVDSFQGGEREVIIISLARSDGVTSFLADKKRLNVSLSRARSKLILLGHGPVLEEHPLFLDLLQDLERVSMCLA
ncbi:MAG: AAA family ATPase [Desulfomonile tiedjei]|uniref:DNA helicase n=1 Tax=Desulfomonile tiedjei TaxID=2358 RepID=A0A9D6Z2I3_9BACT|nr:AAA family ATPase [Desulfomonile tiedjei]